MHLTELRSTKDDYSVVPLYFICLVAFSGVGFGEIRCFGIQSCKM